MSEGVKCEKIPSLYMAPEWRGRFLLKPAGYVRDRRGISLNGAEFRRDIGGVSQLMETQLANIVTH